LLLLDDGVHRVGGQARKTSLPHLKLLWKGCRTLEGWTV
jgi:hypothetical protein